MNKEKLTAALTFTKRVGGMAVGFDPVKVTMQTGESQLVLLAQDLSPKTKKEMLYLCDALEVEYCEIPLNLDELWYLIGKRAGVLAITNQSFANKIKTILREDN